MRISLSIPDEQLKIIDNLCQQQHISRSEFIIRSLSFYIETHLASDVRAQAFGLLKGKAQDGLDYQDKQRDEWD